MARSPDIGVGSEAPSTAPPDVVALFDVLFRNASDCILLTRVDGPVLRANPAACAALGRTEHEVTGEGRQGLVVADANLAALLEVRGRTGIATGEVRFRRPDGSLFVGEVTSALIPGSTGPQRLAYVLFRDASARREVERRETEDAHRLQRIFDTAVDGLCLLALDGRILDTNPAFCELSGYGRDELLRMRISDLEAVEGPSQTASRIERLRRVGFDRFETRQRRRDGRLIDVLVSVSVTRIGEEVLVAFTQDITERKRAEQEAREREARLRAFFESPAVGIGLHDPSGRWSDANPRACEMLGYSLDELRKRTWGQLTHPDDLSQEQREVDRVSRGESDGYALDKRLVRQDGSLLWVLASVSCVRAPDGSLLSFTTIVKDIGRRKEVEEALRRSEATLRAALQNYPAGGMAVFDRELRFVLVGGGPNSATGAPLETLLGRTAWDVYEPPQRDRIVEAFAAAIDGKTSSLEIAFGDRLVEVRCGPVRDSSGRVLFGIGTSLDVTERSRTEHRTKALLSQVQFERDRLKALLDSMKDEVWFMEPEGHVVLANPAAREEFRLGRMAGLGIGDLTRSVEVFRSDGSPRPPDESPLLQALRGGGVVESEEIVRTPALNELRTRQVTASAVKDPMGEVLGAVAVVRDVTAHRQAEAERTRLAMAIEQAAETVVVTDRDGAITYVNPAFERVTGYTRAEVIGRNPRILKSGQQDDAFYRSLWETIAGGGTWRGRLVNQRKDGGRFTEEASISPVRDVSGAIRHFVAVKRDITTELDLESRFLQSQKLESVGRLAGGVAHDFNNLLTVILSAGEDLRRTVREGAVPLVEEIDEIVDAGRRASELTRQLLAFARKQVIAPLIIDLNEAVRSSDRLLRRLIAENIRVAEHLQPGLWPVLCDPGLLDQILMNLVVNARDAMPDGGVLTLGTDNVSVSGRFPVSDVEMQPGDYVKLTVKDTGTGMPPEVLSHVFEPFFTTKAPGTGTGLGLATVYGIVKQSGAFVDVHSEVGVGTRFEIWFPRAARPGEALGDRTPCRVHGGTETILVVEDDANVRHVACRALRSSGYTVLEAPGGRQALALLQREATRVHLLLTDVVMPDVGGGDLARAAVQLHPALRVLFMSGYARDAFGNQVALDDGVSLLPKPFTSEALLARVREALDRPG